MSERQCFHAKRRSYREKGCRKPAVYRVVLGKGLFIDVCEVHVKGYRGLGYRIVELKELEVEPE